MVEGPGGLTGRRFIRAGVRQHPDDSGRCGWPSQANRGAASSCLPGSSGRVTPGHPVLTPSHVSTATTPRSRAFPRDGAVRQRGCLLPTGDSRVGRLCVTLWQRLAVDRRGVLPSRPYDGDRIDIGGRLGRPRRTRSISGRRAGTHRRAFRDRPGRPSSSVRGGDDRLDRDRSALVRRESAAVVLADSPASRAAGGTRESGSSWSPSRSSAEALASWQNANSRSSRGRTP